MSVLRARSSTLSSAGSKSAAANGFNLAGRASKSAGRLLAYSGLHLYEEIVLGFPRPWRERDRVRGKGAATSLLIQTKNALVYYRVYVKSVHKGRQQKNSYLRPFVARKRWCSRRGNPCGCPGVGATRAA